MFSRLLSCYFIESDLVMNINKVIKLLLYQI